MGIDWHLQLSTVWPIAYCTHENLEHVDTTSRYRRHFQDGIVWVIRHWR